MDNETTEDNFLLDSLEVRKFAWPEYVIFFSVLGLSAAIGIFYGCFGSKQKSNEDYILGGRNISAFPAAMSLLTSFISSIAILGFPAEVYLFGMQITSLLMFIPLSLTIYYLYVPVYYNLQLTSAYEYLELRFNRKLRITVSVISIIYLIFYMSLVVYGPSLVLNIVTGIDKKILSAITFSVCIFYSTLGGFKAVIWTDALQGVVLMVSLAAVVGKGISDVGGFVVEWERLEEGKRLEFFK